MTSTVPFVPFPKVPRLSRQVVVSEKIDGSNGQVFIRPMTDTDGLEFGIDTQVDIDGISALIRAGSRNRWLSHGGGAEDNFGFAQWVYVHAHALTGLGFGHHYGEWMGHGVQHGYGLSKGDRRFYLFNTSRWTDNANRPPCCHVVPILHRGPFDTRNIDDLLVYLKNYGSFVVPGFMQPEGIVVYHEASGHLYKKTCEYDDEPKNAHHLRAEGLLPRSTKARPYDPNTTGRRKGCDGFLGIERRVRHEEH